MSLKGPVDLGIGLSLNGNGYRSLDEKDSSPKEPLLREKSSYGSSSEELPLPEITEKKQIYIFDNDDRKIKLIVDDSGKISYEIEAAKGSHMPLIPRHSEYVRKSGYGIAMGSMGTEVLFGGFTAVALLISLDDSTKPGGIDGFTRAFFGGDMPQPVTYAVAITLALLDFIANITGFGPDDESKAFSRDLPDGYIDGVKRLGQHLRKNPLLIPVFVSMVCNFLFGSWADLIPVDGFLKDNLGKAKWIIEAPLLALAYAYYVFFCGKDVIEAVDYFKNKEAKQPYSLEMLDPGIFKYILPKINPKYEPASWQPSTAWQILFEGGSQHLIRGSTFAALGALFFKDGLGLDGPVSKLTAEILGGTTGAFISILTRHVRVGTHYLGSSSERLDLVNETERDLYWKAMSWSQYFGRKALQSPMTALQSYAHGVLTDQYIPRFSSLFTIPLDKIGIVSNPTPGGAVVAGALGAFTHWRAATKEQLQRGFLQASKNAYSENFFIVMRDKENPKTSKKPHVNSALAAFKKVAKAASKKMESKQTVEDAIVTLKLLNKTAKTANVVAKHIAHQIDLCKKLQEENIVEKILAGKADPVVSMAIELILKKNKQDSGKWCARVSKNKETVGNAIAEIQNRLLSDLQDLKEVMSYLTSAKSLPDDQEVTKLQSENTNLVKQIQWTISGYQERFAGSREAKYVATEVRSIIQIIDDLKQQVNSGFTVTVRETKIQDEMQTVRARTGILKSEDKHASTMKTALSTKYEIGTAYDKGDCFFDSVAQQLLAIGVTIPGDLNQDGCKKIRVLCNQYLKSDQSKLWAKEKIDNDAKTGGQSFEICLATSAFTQPEMETMKKGDIFSGLSTWGRPQIEGRIICEQFKIKLHVVELSQSDDHQIVVHQLIDSTGSKTVSEDEINLQDTNLVHIALYRSHYVPLQPKQRPLANNRNIASPSVHAGRSAFSALSKPQQGNLEHKIDIKDEKAEVSQPLMNLLTQQIYCHQLVDVVKGKVKNGNELENRVKDSVRKAKDDLFATIFKHQQSHREQEKLEQINNLIQIIGKQLLDLGTQKDKLELKIKDQKDKLNIKETDKEEKTGKKDSRKKESSPEIDAFEGTLKLIERDIIKTKNDIARSTGQEKRRFKAKLRKLERDASDVKGWLGTEKEKVRELKKLDKHLVDVQQEIETLRTELTCLVEIHHALSKGSDGVRRFLKEDFDLTSMVRLLSYLFDPHFWRKPKLGGRQLNVILPAGSPITMQKHLKDLRELEKEADVIEGLDLDSAIAYLSDHKDIYEDQVEDLANLRQHRCQLVSSYLQCKKENIIEEAPTESGVLAEIVNIGSQLARTGTGGGLYQDKPRAGFVVAGETSVSNYRFMDKKIKANLPKVGQAIKGFFTGKQEEEKPEVRKANEALRATYR